MRPNDSEDIEKIKPGGRRKAGWNLFVKPAFFLFLIFIALSSWNNRLWALTSDDIVIVFNVNSSDSLSVANYCAAKSRISQIALLAGG